MASIPQMLSDQTEFLAAWEKVRPYTMTSPERGFALWQAVHNVLDANIPGALVECGVWRGGSAMLMILALQARGVTSRGIVLFDTFSGMTEPGPHDSDLNGADAAALMSGAKGDRIANLVTAAADFEAVRDLIASTGYDMRLVRFVGGDVRETLQITSTLRIALLRLDTDFYDSTQAELQELYPRLVQGGVLIVDDYGHWRGCRKAVDDYFNQNPDGFQRPMFWPLDYTGIGGVKVESKTRVEIERYDYIPPGMTSPDLLPLFPQATAGNAWAVKWPHLRKSIPHIWRYDTRHTGYATGYASVEEAACLYTIASAFKGRRALEIGSHFGWSAAHLLAAGVRLDCIDPAFFDNEHRSAVAATLDATKAHLPGAGSYLLWAGESPGLLTEVFHAGHAEPWSMVFIDGDHEGDAPADDARAVIPYMADDSIAVFHDLTSPHVEAGLRVFRNTGFNTKLFNTAQIIGIAWRGDVTPPSHQSDPNVGRLFYRHLADYQVDPQLSPLDMPNYRR